MMGILMQELYCARLVSNILAEFPRRNIHVDMFEAPPAELLIDSRKKQPRPFRAQLSQVPPASLFIRDSSTSIFFSSSLCASNFFAFHGARLPRKKTNRIEGIDHVCAFGPCRCRRND